MDYLNCHYDASFVFEGASTGQKMKACMEDFLTKVDMSDKVITAVLLPSLEGNVVYRSFKITPRWQVSVSYN